MVVLWWKSQYRSAAGCETQPCTPQNVKRCTKSCGLPVRIKPTVQVEQVTKTSCICKEKQKQIVDLVMHSTSAWISTWRFTFILFLIPPTFLSPYKNEVERMTETEDLLLNGQLVPCCLFPIVKYRLWMVAVLNKAEWRPKRRAPPQVSPGTFLNSCHWIRACLSGCATGGQPHWRVSHQSSPADLLAAGLNMADASVIAPRPFSPIAFFPPPSLLFLFPLSCVALTPSHRRGWLDAALINAKKRRRRDSTVSLRFPTSPWFLEEFMDLASMCSD